MKDLRLMSGVLVLASVAASTGCATTNTEATARTTTTRTVRRRPRRRDVTHALAEATRRAAECLPPAASSVAVTGAFVGDSGEFHVDDIAPEVPIGSAVRTCVREEFEAARVSPFADARYPAMRRFVPDGTLVAESTGAAAESPETAPALATASPSAPPPDTAIVAAPANPTPPVVVPSASPAPVDVASTAPAPSAAPTASPAPTAIATAAPRPLLSRDAVVACHTAALRADPTSGGRLRVQFEVTDEGTTRNVSVRTFGAITGAEAAISGTARCIERRMRGNTFARTASGAYDYAVSIAPGPNGARVNIEARTIAGAATPANQASTTEAITAAPRPTTAAGTRNQQIADAVRARINEITTCYNHQLERSTDLGLQTRVRFTITPTGGVSSASSTTMVLGGDMEAATAVAECVEEIVRTTSFPALANGQPLETSLPFRFSPRPATAAPATSTAAVPAGNTTGRIDPAATSATVREHAAALRVCYTNQLERHPNLRGRVTVRFVVAIDGSVHNATAQISMVEGDREAMNAVGHCVESVMQSLSLPSPNGGAASVALPFDFAPNTP